LALIFGVSPRLPPILWGPGHLLLGGLAGWVVYRTWRAAPRSMAVPIVHLVVGASQVLAWQILPAMNQKRSARAAAERLRVATAGAPVDVVGRVEPGIVFYLGLIPPHDNEISPAEIRLALRTGRRVLVATTTLPAGILDTPGVVVRARVRLDYSEYLVLASGAE